MKKKILLWSVLLCILGSAFSVAYASARRVATASLIDFPSITDGITVNGSCAFGGVRFKTNSILLSGIKFANSYQDKGVLDANYVTLNIGGFKAGDIVTIAGVYNNDAAKNAKIDIFTLDASNNYTVLFTTQQFVNGRTSNDEPVEETFVVTEDVDKLYLGRNGNTNTYVTKLSVTRAEDWNVASGQYQLMGGSWTDIPTTEPAKVAFVGNDVYLRLTVSGINVSIKGEKSGNTVTFPKNQTVALSTLMTLYLMGTSDGTTASDIIFEYDSETNTLSQACTIVASSSENGVTNAMVTLKDIVVQNPAGPMSEEADVLTSTLFGVSGETSYSAVTGVTATSNAVYAGNLAGGNNAIQLRTNSSNSGIVTTASGGTVKSIKIEWNSNTDNSRTLLVYGKKSAYEAATDLYDSSKQGALIASFVKSDGDKTVEITGDYQFVGFRSSNNAMYINKITIVWDVPSSAIKADPEISYTTTEYEITIDESSSFVAPTLNNPHDLTVTYSSNNESIALVDENTGEVVLADHVGEATITATFAGNDSYKAGSASYTITITDPTVKGTKDNPYTVADVIDGTATGDGVYVIGYIVGNYNATAPINPATGDTNLAIADAANETNGSNTIPVELTSANNMRTNWAPSTNNNIGYKVLVKGNIKSYFSVNGIKGSKEITAVSVPATVTAAGWATWVAPVNVTVPSGVEAYAVSLSGTHTELNALEAIPAGTPVLLKNEGTFEFPVATETPAAVTTALLVSEGVAVANAFVLAKKDGVVGFYRWIGSDPIPEGKVYLIYTGSGAPDFIGFGDATGIETLNVENGTLNGEVYNLAGQRVAQPVKGLYIVNGKKVIIK